MIYPLTEQTPVLQHNAALQRYVRRYADIEKQTQHAIAQYGLSFESPYRRQAETDA
ncbi:radical SAM protein, partial [Morganella morganii]|nr:radical SAM protein [Morganella morganii]